MVDVVGLRFVTDGQMEALNALRDYQNGLKSLADMQNKHVATMNRALAERERAEQRAARTAEQAAAAAIAAQNRRDAEDRRAYQNYLRYNREKEAAAQREARVIEQAAQEAVRAQQRQAQETEALARSYNPLMAATAAYEREVVQLTRAEQLGVLTKEQLDAKLAQLSTAYMQAGTSVANATRFMNQYGQGVNVAGMRTNRFGMYAQQVGYQVGDFFVQIQSGTNAFVAFGQQATQLAGLLPGVLGAVLGIGISVSTMFLAMWSRSRQAAEGAKTLDESFGGLTAALDAYVQAAVIANSSTSELEERFGNFAGEVRAAAEVLMQARMALVFDEARSAALALRNEFSSVTDAMAEVAARTEQLALAESLGAGLDEIASIQAFMDLFSQQAADAAEAFGLLPEQVKYLDTLFEQFTAATTFDEMQQSAALIVQAAEDFRIPGEAMNSRLAAVVAEVSQFVINMAEGRTETERAANAARGLGVVLASMTMSSNPASEAQFLAQQLGIALNVATALNNTLNQQAGTEAPDSGPRLGFGIGSTMDDPLSTGMANTVLGFGNVEDAANQTWRAVRELTSGLGDLNATAAGGGSPGGGGSTVDAMEQVRAEMETATQAIVDEANRVREEGIGQIADDLGNVFAGFFESGFRDFESFTDGILGVFQKMLVDMAAEAASAQIMRFLTSSGGGVAGGAAAATSGAAAGGGVMGALSTAGGAAGAMTGLGGAIAGLAGPAAIAIGLFSIFRARQQRRNQEEKKESDERYRLETRLLELQGRTRALREREIAALQPGNRALGRRIQRLEEEARIAAERDALESQLLELQGNTAEIRRRELATLNESNRALQEHIWMLEDQAAAAAEAAAVQQERMSLEQQRLTLLGREDLLREMQLASLDESNRALQEQIWALEDQAAAAEDVARIADERAGLERQLLELQGDTAALRALELEQLDASNRALQEQIWALEDQAAAAEEAARIASERADLERQLLQLQGNTAELRRRELETLDPTNRALQEQIWLMEDMQAVAEERESLERRLLELQGDTAALRAMDLAALDESNRALQEQIWALEDMQRALDALDMNDFMSLIEYNRAVAQANAGIMGLTANTNGVPSAASISTVPMPPVTNTTPITTSGSASSTMTDAQVRDAIRNLTDITQQLLTRIDNNTRRSRDILTVWDEDGLPEERVA